jgi:hypothetical protein
LTSHRQDALCWNDGGGGTGVAVADLSHCGNFQAKGTANRGKPMSTSAVGGAAASASTALPERRRSTLLDSGKSMVQRLASSVADRQTGNSSGLAASRLEGVLEVAIFASNKGSPTWRSFLRNHMTDIAAVDMFVVATATFGLLYAVIVLDHRRRRIIHFEVTQNPTQA